MATIARILVALAGVTGALVVLGSAVRSVVLPKAVPARLARVAFLAVRLPLSAAAAGHTRRGRWHRRENLLALQGPMGILAQLATWTVLVALAFTAVLWAVERRPLSYDAIRDAASESGSSLTTLGIVHPAHVAGEFVAFTEAGIGLVLLALVVTYLPTIYGAFARREAVVAKLAVRVGSPPTPTALLRRSWELGRFDRLEEVWNSWEDWFVDVGESHTSFPQLIFFRSHRPDMSWVTSAGAVLDAAALARTALDVELDSRSELTIEAGVSTFDLIGRFMGVPPGEEEQERSRGCRARCSSTRSTSSSGSAFRSRRIAIWRGRRSRASAGATSACCSRSPGWSTRWRRSGCPPSCSTPIARPSCGRTSSKRPRPATDSRAHARPPRGSARTIVLSAPEQGADRDEHRQQHGEPPDARPTPSAVELGSSTNASRPAAPAANRGGLGRSTEKISATQSRTISSARWTSRSASTCALKTTKSRPRTSVGPRRPRRPARRGDRCAPVPSGPGPGAGFGGLTDRERMPISHAIICPLRA